MSHEDRRPKTKPVTGRHRLNLRRARGLVTRKQDPADRRANVLTLTPEGKRLMGQLKAAAAF